MSWSRQVAEQISDRLLEQKKIDRNREIKSSLADQIVGLYISLLDVTVPPSAPTWLIQCATDLEKLKHLLPFIDEKGKLKIGAKAAIIKLVPPAEKKFQFRVTRPAPPPPVSPKPPTVTASAVATPTDGRTGAIPAPMSPAGTVALTPAAATPTDGKAGAMSVPMPSARTVAITPAAATPTGAPMSPAGTVAITPAVASSTENKRFDFSSTSSAAAVIAAALSSSSRAPAALDKKQTPQVPVFNFTGIPNLGKSNILADWNREIHNPGVSIDGEDVRDLLYKFKKLRRDAKDFESVRNLIQFDDETQLRDFLKIHFLKQMDEDKKEEVMGYLMRALHQGGLLSPLPAELADIIREKTLRCYDFPSTQHFRTTSFRTTPTGFALIQSVTVPKLVDSHTAELGDQAYLDPDSKANFVFKVTAIVHVNFNINPSDPAIYVTDEQVEWGSKDIKHILTFKSKKAAKPIFKFTNDVNEKDAKIVDDWNRSVLTVMDKDRKGFDKLKSQFATQWATQKLTNEQKNIRALALLQKQNARTETQASELLQEKKRESWAAIAPQSKFTINGKDVFILLQDERPPLSKFDDKSVLRKFFRKHLLTSITDESKAEEAVTYLMRTLHQGGLLHPVAGAISEQIMPTREQLADHKFDRYAFDQNTRKRNTAFVTTSEGFSVTETVAYQTVIRMFDPEHPILPDTKEKDYILIASATFNVDLKANPAKPMITVTDEYESWGTSNKGVKDFFENMAARREAEAKVVAFAPTVAAAAAAGDSKSADRLVAAAAGAAGDLKSGEPVAAAAAAAGDIKSAEKPVAAAAAAAGDVKSTDKLAAAVSVADAKYGINAELALLATRSDLVEEIKKGSINFPQLLLSLTSSARPISAKALLAWIATTLKTYQINSLESKSTALHFQGVSALTQDQLDYFFEQLDTVPYFTEIKVDLTVPATATQEAVEQQFRKRATEIAARNKYLQLHNADLTEADGLTKDFWEAAVKHWIADKGDSDNDRLSIQTILYYQSGAKANKEMNLCLLDMRDRFYEKIVGNLAGYLAVRANGGEVSSTYEKMTLNAISIASHTDDIKQHHNEKQMALTADLITSFTNAVAQYPLSQIIFQGTEIVEKAKFIEALSAFITRLSDPALRHLPLQAMSLHVIRPSLNQADLEAILKLIQETQCRVYIDLTKLTIGNPAAVKVCVDINNAVASHRREFNIARSKQLNKPSSEAKLSIAPSHLPQVRTTGKKGFWTSVQGAQSTDQLQTEVHSQVEVEQHQESFQTVTEVKEREEEKIHGVVSPDGLVSRDNISDTQFEMLYHTIRKPAVDTRSSVIFEGMTHKWNQWIGEDNANSPHHIKYLTRAALYELVRHEEDFAYGVSEHNPPPGFFFQQTPTGERVLNFDPTRESKEQNPLTVKLLKKPYKLSAHFDCDARQFPDFDEKENLPIFPCAVGIDANILLKLLRDGHHSGEVKAQLIRNAECKKLLDHKGGTPSVMLAPMYRHAFYKFMRAENRELSHELITTYKDIFEVEFDAKNIQALWHIFYEQGCAGVLVLMQKLDTMKRKGKAGPYKSVKSLMNKSDNWLEFVKPTTLATMDKLIAFSASDDPREVKLFDALLQKYINAVNWADLNDLFAGFEYFCDQCKEITRRVLGFEFLPTPAHFEHVPNMKVALDRLLFIIKGLAKSPQRLLAFCNSEGPYDLGPNGAYYAMRHEGFTAITKKMALEPSDMFSGVDSQFETKSPTRPRAGVVSAEGKASGVTTPVKQIPGFMSAETIPRVEVSPVRPKKGLGSAAAAADDLKTPTKVMVSPVKIGRDPTRREYYRVDRTKLANAAQADAKYVDLNQMKVIFYRYLGTQSCLAILKDYDDLIAAITSARMTFFMPTGSMEHYSFMGMEYFWRRVQKSLMAILAFATTHARAEEVHNFPANVPQQMTALIKTVTTFVHESKELGQKQLDIALHSVLEKGFKTEPEMTLQDVQHVVSALLDKSLVPPRSAVHVDEEKFSKSVTDVSNTLFTYVAKYKEVFLKALEIYHKNPERVPITLFLECIDIREKNEEFKDLPIEKLMRVFSVMSARAFDNSNDIKDLLKALNQFRESNVLLDILARINPVESRHRPTFQQLMKVVQSAPKTSDYNTLMRYLQSDPNFRECRFTESDDLSNPATGAQQMQRNIQAGAEEIARRFKQIFDRELNIAELKGPECRRYLKGVVEQLEEEALHPERAVATDAKAKAAAKPELKSVGLFSGGFSLSSLAAHAARIVETAAISAVAALPIQSKLDGAKQIIKKHLSDNLQIILKDRIAALEGASDTQESKRGHDSKSSGAGDSNESKGSNDSQSSRASQRSASEVKAAAVQVARLNKLIFEKLMPNESGVILSVYLDRLEQFESGARRLITAFEHIKQQWPTEIPWLVTTLRDAPYTGSDVCPIGFIAEVLASVHEGYKKEEGQHQKIFPRNIIQLIFNHPALKGLQGQLSNTLAAIKEVLSFNHKIFRRRKYQPLSSEQIEELLHLVIQEGAAKKDPRSLVAFLFNKRKICPQGFNALLEMFRVHEKGLSHAAPDEKVMSLESKSHVAEATHLIDLLTPLDALELSPDTLARLFQLGAEMASIDFSLLIKNTNDENKEKQANIIQLLVSCVDPLFSDFKKDKAILIPQLIALAFSLRSLDDGVLRRLIQLNPLPKLDRLNQLFTGSIDQQIDEFERNPYPGPRIEEKMANVEEKDDKDAIKSKISPDKVVDIIRHIAELGDEKEDRPLLFGQQRQLLNWYSLVSALGYNQDEYPILVKSVVADEKGGRLPRESKSSPPKFVPKKFAVQNLTQADMLGKIDACQKVLQNDKATKKDKIGARLAFLAIAREVMYRKTGKFPNATQIICVLDIIQHRRYNMLAEIATGEGKGIIAALVAALLWLEGQTVDVCTSNSQLAKEHLDDFRNFYTYMRVPVGASNITEGSRLEDYKHGGINYSDVGQLILFRTRMLLETPPEVRATWPKVSLVLDEAEFTMLDDPTLYRSARDLSPAGRHLWIYSALNNFIDTPGRLTPDDTDHSGVDKARRHLMETAATDHQRSFVQNKNQLTDEQLKDWLISAFAAKKLVADYYDPAVIQKAFAIKQEERMIGGEKRKIQVARLYGANKRLTLAQWSKGVQQFVHDRLDAVERRKAHEAGRPDLHIPFLVEPELSTVVSTSTKVFMDYYTAQNTRTPEAGPQPHSRIIGLTGTIGSLEERKEHFEKHEFKMHHFAQHHIGQRVDRPPKLKLNKQDHYDKIGVEVMRHLSRKYRYVKQSSGKIERVEVKDTEPQPMLIVCESAGKAREIYESLLKIRDKFGPDAKRFQLYTAEDTKVDDANSNLSEKEIVAHAGVCGCITITTEILGRGTNILPRTKLESKEQDYQYGLFMLQTYLASERSEGQNKGRPARQGWAGETLILVNQEDLVPRLTMDEKKEVDTILDKDEVVGRLLKHRKHLVSIKGTRERQFRQLGSDIIDKVFQQWCELYFDAPEQLRNSLVLEWVSYLEKIERQWKEIVSKHGSKPLAGESKEDRDFILNKCARLLIGELGKPDPDLTPWNIISGWNALITGFKQKNSDKVEEVVATLDPMELYRAVEIIPKQQAVKKGIKDDWTFEPQAQASQLHGYHADTDAAFIEYAPPGTDADIRYVKVIPSVIRQFEKSLEKLNTVVPGNALAKIYVNREQPEGSLHVIMCMLLNEIYNAYISRVSLSPFDDHYQDFMDCYGELMTKVKECDLERIQHTVLTAHQLHYESLLDKSAVDANTREYLVIFMQRMNHFQREYRDGRWNFDARRVAAENVKPREPEHKSAPNEVLTACKENVTDLNRVLKEPNPMLESILGQSKFEADTLQSAIYWVLEGIYQTRTNKKYYADRGHYFSCYRKVMDLITWSTDAALQAKAKAAHALHYKSLEEAQALASYTEQFLKDTPLTFTYEECMGKPAKAAADHKVPLSAAISAAAASSSAAAGPARPSLAKRRHSKYVSRPSRAFSGDTTATLRRELRARSRGDSKDIADRKREPLVQLKNWADVPGWETLKAGLIKIVRHYLGSVGFISRTREDAAKALIVDIEEAASPKQILLRLNNARQNALADDLAGDVGKIIKSRNTRGSRFQEMLNDARSYFFIHCGTKTLASLEVLEIQDVVTLVTHLKARIEDTQLHPPKDKLKEYKVSVNGSQTKFLFLQKLNELIGFLNQEHPFHIKREKLAEVFNKYNEFDDLPSDVRNVCVWIKMKQLQIRLYEQLGPLVVKEEKRGAMTVHGKSKKFEIRIREDKVRCDGPGWLVDHEHGSGVLDEKGDALPSTPEESDSPSPSATPQPRTPPTVSPKAGRSTMHRTVGIMQGLSPSNPKSVAAGVIADTAGPVEAVPVRAKAGAGSATGLVHVEAAPARAKAGAGSETGLVHVEAVSVKAKAGAGASLAASDPVEPVLAKMKAAGAAPPVLPPEPEAAPAESTGLTAPNKSA